MNAQSLFLKKSDSKARLSAMAARNGPLGWELIRKNPNSLSGHTARDRPANHASTLGWAKCVRQIAASKTFNTELPIWTTNSAQTSMNTVLSNTHM
jgi:hypothetical protein